MQSAGDKSARRDVRSATADEVRFGGFRYLPDQSLLLKDGKRVRIGSRALCLLKPLIDNAGQFVSNDRLIAGAWPNTHVDDTNLRVQMTALRRLLSVDGDFMRITNAPGRGYALTIAPDGLEASEWLAKPLKEPLPTNSLPAQLTSLVGREDAVATVIKNLSARRFVSVVGPGGIGKTRVAIEVCGRLIDEGDQRIHFVDLAPLASGEFVATAVASALTHDDEAQTSPFGRIVGALRRSRAVLALDNCEHVLDTVATLSEGLLRAAPDLRILATSSRASAGRWRSHRSFGWSWRTRRRSRAIDAGTGAGLSRHPALRGARSGRCRQFVFQGLGCADAGRHMPASRRHSTGDRIGGGESGLVGHPGRCSACPRPDRHAFGGTQNRAATTAHNAGHAGVELRQAVERRENAARSTVDIPLHVLACRRPGGERRAAGTDNPTALRPGRKITCRRRLPARGHALQAARNNPRIR